MNTPESLSHSERSQKQAVTRQGQRDILNLLTDFIALCTVDYEIVDSNHAADIVLGKGKSIIGTKCYETFRGVDAPCSDCPLSITFESGTLFPLNFYDTRYDEYFEERTHPIVSDTGTLDGFVLVSRNQTKAVELGNKNAQAKKLAAIGQISSGVAHDFNNVLTAVIGRVQILKKNIHDPELLQHLDIIEKAAKDGAETVRRMQDYTRAKREVQFERVNLKKLIEDVVAITRPKWRDSVEMQGRIIEVNLDLMNDLEIMGNESDLRSSFTNIIFNAVDAMPDGGVLTISLDQEDHKVVVRFQDTGIGMTEETKERIFDPFFTTKGVKGNGLGMTEVFGAIKRHDGDIEVESEVGRGTRITLIFPVTQKLEVKEVAEEPSEFVSRRILVIDDEEYILDITKELLEDLGHQVGGYTSAYEGIEAFREQPFDMVITDLGMPEISGQEVAEKIKAISPTTPVILLSGWSVNLEEDKELGSVIDFALTKPFSLDEIQRAIVQATNLARQLQTGDRGVE
jgi:signal transduction histidine kinase/CheY-like chemotaxis protein